MKMKKTASTADDEKPKFDITKIPAEVRKINRIKCTVCGSVKGVRPEIVMQRIVTYGSLEELLAKYECMQCRKKEGSAAPKRPKKVRKAKIGGRAHFDSVDPITGEGRYFWQIPGWNGFSSSAPYVATRSIAEYKGAFGSTCARPGLYLDNGKYCDGCIYWETCICTLKRSREEGGVYVNKTEEEKEETLSYYQRKKLGLLTKTYSENEEGVVGAMKELPVDSASLRTGNEPPTKKLNYYQRKKLGLLKWTKKPK